MKEPMKLEDTASPQLRLTRTCEQGATASLGTRTATFTPMGPIAALLEEAELERELQSSITTAWRVTWTPQECARDLFQNFRDANADALEKITIATTESMAVIMAPAPMDLECAYFLGSTKAKEAGDIGQFGEGLKVAFLCLLRDTAQILPWPAATGRCGSNWARSIPRCNSVPWCIASSGFRPHGGPRVRHSSLRTRP